MKDSMTAVRPNRRCKGHPGQRHGQGRGYSLVELLVVMVIIGILATQVVISMTSALTKVKGVAFTMRSDLNLAQSEAIGRNREVRIDFIMPADAKDLNDDGVATDSGYWICIDNDSSTNGCGAGDVQIKKVAFPDVVRFYAPGNPITVAEGPTHSQAGANLAGNDGVSFSGSNWFNMRADGSASRSGYVIFYAPDDPDAPTKMEATPFALAILGSTGRVRLWYWDNGAWVTK